jgi:uncharacterized protein (UPF0128 family)
MDELEKILQWWEQSQSRQKIVSINAIEKEAGVGRGTFQYFLNRKRSLPLQHLNILKELLNLIGYNS